MTYTEAVELLERYGVKVSLGSGNLGLIRDCAEIIQRLDTTPECPLIGRFNVRELVNGDILVFRDSECMMTADVLTDLRQRLEAICPDLAAKGILVLALPTDEDELTVALGQMPMKLDLCEKILGSLSPEDRRTFLQQQMERSGAH